MYSVEFTRKAAAAVRGLPKAHKDSLRRVVDALAENPFSYPYRKVRGRTSLYRIRLGEHRLL